MEIHALWAKSDLSSQRAKQFVPFQRLFQIRFFWRRFYIVFQKQRHSSVQENFCIGFGYSHIEHEQLLIVEVLRLRIFNIGLGPIPRSLVRKDRHVLY